MPDRAETPPNPAPGRTGRNGPRIIHPLDCTDDALAACSIEAQLLYDRIRLQVDDQGRMLGKPKVVAALCMPLIDAATPEAVDAWLQELHEHELIQRYGAGPTDLVQMLRWHLEEAGLRRTYPSRWPAPNGWTDWRKGFAAADHEPECEHEPEPEPNRTEGSGQAARTSRADSPQANGQVRHFGNLYRAFEELKGRSPSEGEVRVIEEMAKRHGREHVAASMYRITDPGAPSFLGRVGADLRGEVVAA